MKTYRVDPFMGDQLVDLTVGDLMKLLRGRMIRCGPFVITRRGVRVKSARTIAQEEKILKAFSRNPYLALFEGGSLPGK